MRGIFITMEGPDGAGKTSVVQELVPRLERVANVAIKETREPGGSPIAEKIRQVILDRKNVEMDARTEALLYAAARRQHLVETISPNLNVGKIVICDRFVDSSVAYQGVGRKIGMEDIENINQFATNGLVPDLTLYLDIDSDTALTRIKRNRSEMDRLEVEGIQFHQRVRHGYLKILQENPNRIVKIDARQSLREVVDSCFDEVIERFPEYFSL